MASCQTYNSVEDRAILNFHIRFSAPKFCLLEFNVSLMCPGGVKHKLLLLIKVLLEFCIVRYLALFDKLNAN